MAIGIFYTEVIVVVKCAISNWPSEGHYFFEDLVEDWSLLTSPWWRLMSQLKAAPMKSMKRTFNGSSTLLKSKCPKERRTSYGGNQMSFPHCRPLAFVSLATFVIWDSVKTCQNHRDLTRFDTVCHVDPCVACWPWMEHDLLRGMWRPWQKNWWIPMTVELRKSAIEACQMFLEEFSSFYQGSFLNGHFARSWTWQNRLQHQKVSCSNWPTVPSSAIAVISYSVVLLPWHLLFCWVFAHSFRTRHLLHRPASVADRDAVCLGQEMCVWRCLKNN